MVNSKYLMEQELKKSGLQYVIYRPTGYFYAARIEEEKGLK